jgi:hypothetical protein
MITTINKINYEFITVEWIESRIRDINIIDDTTWNEPTNEVIRTYTRNFAELLYQLFKRGLGFSTSYKGEYIMAGFDFNKFEINEGKSLNRTDLQGAKEKLKKEIESINGLMTNFKKDLESLKEQLEAEKNKLVSYKAYDVSGSEMTLPITCTEEKFVLKYGCKNDIVGPYWQLET